MMLFDITSIIDGYLINPEKDPYVVLESSLALSYILENQNNFLGSFFVNMAFKEYTEYSKDFKKGEFPQSPIINNSLDPNKPTSCKDQGFVDPKKVTDGLNIFYCNDVDFREGGYAVFWGALNEVRDILDPENPNRPKFLKGIDFYYVHLNYRGKTWQFLIQDTSQPRVDEIFEVEDKFILR